MTLAQAAKQVPARVTFASQKSQGTRLKPKIYCLKKASRRFSFLMRLCPSSKRITSSTWSYYTKKTAGKSFNAVSPTRRIPKYEFLVKREESKAPKSGLANKHYLIYYPIYSLPPNFQFFVFRHSAFRPRPKHSTC